MQADEFLAMIMAFLFVSTPFVLYGFLRYLRHRETLFLAERGDAGAVKLVEELGNATVVFQKAETEKASLWRHHNDTHIGELARFNKRAKAQQGILAGKLFHCVSQKSFR